MDTIKFEWDENKNTINKKKHNVSFEEAMTVFYDEEALLINDPEHSDEEERFILLGFRLKRVGLNVPEELVFPHIAALFVSLYVSMVSPKKHHTARKNKPFRCEAVFKEQIFVETRQKSE